MSMTTTAVKERPIIFTAHSVRRILSGAKTQTRRVVKPQPVRGCWGAPMGPDDWAWKYPKSVATRISCKPNGPDGWEEFCPYGRVGDRLWVKEAWLPKSCAGYLNEDDGAITITYADGAEVYVDDHGDRMPADWTIPKATKKGPLTPLFMPRWASRLTLEITGVRVERLEDISEEDAKAEGVELEPCTHPDCQSGQSRCAADSYRGAFAVSWNKINAARGYPWGSKPWVWVVEFKRLEQA